MPRTSSLVSSLGFVSMIASTLVTSGCGGRGALEPGPGQIVLRYEPTVGGSTRYHHVLRSVPGDAPGRSVSAHSRLAVRGEPAPGHHRVQVTFGDVHLAGERGSAVDVDEEVTVTLTLDEQRRVEGEPAVEGRDAEAAPDLTRVLVEGITFPLEPIGVGDTWALPALERPLPGEQQAEVAREARLANVDDGVARVEVTGTVSAPAYELDGARIEVGGEHTGHFDVRVADGLLIEASETTAVELRSRLGDGTDVGRITHRTRSLTQRVAGTMPDPVTHDWRPDALSASCEARLTAMRRRFDQAPRDVDLGAVAVSDMALAVRGDARDIDQDGPTLVGIDEETFLGALGGSDLRRALVAYVLAPAEADDEDLRAWLSDVPSTVELRRVVVRQVDPPSPPSPDAVDALYERMRGADDRDALWQAALRPQLAICQAARDAFDAASELEAAERPRVLRSGLHEAFGRCGCDAVDLALLERTVDLRYGGPHLGWTPLR